MSNDNFIVQKLHADGVLRARANAVAFNTTHKLKRIAMQCVLKHRAVFCGLAQLEAGTNPFCVLPATLLNEMLELECDRQVGLVKLDVYDSGVEEQCRVLQLTLSSELRKFRFPPELRARYEDAATQLWQALLAEDRHKLASIVFRRSFHRQRDWGVEDFFHNMLPAFPSLVELRLDCFVCDDAILGSIADHLPLLRFLEVALLEDVSRVGFMALSKLKQLQEFIFDKDFNQTFEVKKQVYMRMCFELVPQLHVACHKPVKRGRCLPDLAKGTSRALQQITRTTILQLRYLVLAHLDTFIPDHVSVSEVQQLFVEDESAWDDEYGNLLLQPIEARRFPNLTHLIMSPAKVADLMRAVGIFGRQLQTLRFSVRHDFVPLGRVLDKCPNLSELSCLGERTADESFQKLRRDTLRNLQVLRIECTIQVGDVQPSLALQLLLLAPNLVNVELSSTLLSIEDLQRLTVEVEQRQCLQVLERLMVYPDHLADNYTEQWKRLLDMAFATSSIHCDKLRQAISDPSISMG